MLFLNIATGVVLVLIFAGMVAGVIAPSSSAIAMLSVQMLTESALTAGRMLAEKIFVWLAKWRSFNSVWSLFRMVLKTTSAK